MILHFMHDTDLRQHQHIEVDFTGGMPLESKLLPFAFGYLLWSLFQEAEVKNVVYKVKEQAY